MSLSVIYSIPAVTQITEFERQWRANQAQAPTRFLEELVGAIALLRKFPLMGKSYKETSLPNVRRLLLSEVGHYLYYSYDISLPQLQILALWGISEQPLDLTQK